MQMSGHVIVSGALNLLGKDDFHAILCIKINYAIVSVNVALAKSVYLVFHTYFINICLVFIKKKRRKEPEYRLGITYVEG